MSMKSTEIVTVVGIEICKRKQIFKHLIEIYPTEQPFYVRKIVFILKNQDLIEVGYECESCTDFWRKVNHIYTEQ